MPEPITPSHWGEALWRVMHVFALGYSADLGDSERESYAAFYESLKTVIPCPTCRSDYAAILRAFPVRARMRDAEDLFRWTVKVHDQVSLRTGRPRVTEEIARDVYVFGRSPSSKSREAAATAADAAAADAAGGGGRHQAARDREAEAAAAFRKGGDRDAETEEANTFLKDQEVSEHLADLVPLCADETLCRSLLSGIALAGAAAALAILRQGS